MGHEEWKEHKPGSVSNVKKILDDKKSAKLLRLKNVNM